jgi:hypothetical protein
MKVLMNGLDMARDPIKVVIETKTERRTIEGDEMIVSLVAGSAAHILRELVQGKKKVWLIEALIPWPEVQSIDFDHTLELSEQDWSIMKEGINPPLSFEELSEPSKGGLN